VLDAGNSVRARVGERLNVNFIFNKWCWFVLWVEPRRVIDRRERKWGLKPFGITDIDIVIRTWLTVTIVRL